MGRIHNGPGHSTVGEEENEVVLPSVTQSRVQAHCATILIGNAILGNSSPRRARKEAFVQQPISHWPGPWWVESMVYAYKRASERGDTLKRVHFLM